MKEKLLTGNKLVAANFATIRSDFDLSQLAFSKELKLNQSNIAAIEKGIQAPSQNTCIRLNQKFGVNINWLLTGIGTPYLGAKKKTKDEKSAMKDLIEYVQHLSDVIDNQKQTISLLEKELAICRKTKR